MFQEPGGVNLVGGGTDPILSNVFKGIVVDGLNQSTDQVLTTWFLKHPF